MGQNCWEVMKCEREPGGAKVAEYGVCPAAVSNQFDGKYGGECAGRYCWGLAKTLCGGKVQSSFASKLMNCASCKFYHQVQREIAGSEIDRLMKVADVSPRAALTQGWGLLEAAIMKEGIWDQDPGNFQPVLEHLGGSNRFSEGELERLEEIYQIGKKGGLPDGVVLTRQLVEAYLELVMRGIAEIEG